MKHTNIMKHAYRATQLLFIGLTIFGFTKNIQIGMTLLAINSMVVLAIENLLTKMRELELLENEVATLKERVELIKQEKEKSQEREGIANDN